MSNIPQSPPTLAATANSTITGGGFRGKSWRTGKVTQTKKEKAEIMDAMVKKMFQAEIMATGGLFTKGASAQMGEGVKKIISALEEAQGLGSPELFNEALRMYYKEGGEGDILGMISKKDKFKNVADNAIIADREFTSVRPG